MKLLIPQNKSNEEDNHYLKENERGIVDISCCDFRKLTEIIPDKKLSLILTDPPYNLGEFTRIKNRNVHTLNNRDNFILHGWDNSTEEEFKVLMENFFSFSVQKLQKGGAILMFCAFFKVGFLVNLAEKFNFYYKTAGVWHKTNPMPLNMNLHFVPSNEAWLYLINNNKTGTFNNEGKLITDFIETSIISNSEKKFGKHPTQKPLKLMEYFVKLLTNKGDFVCDPFMGSGTVALASNNLSRNFIGAEINKDYFKIAYNRLEGSI